jgi:hypothetical protein
MPFRPESRSAQEAEAVVVAMRSSTMRAARANIQVMAWDISPALGN